MRNEIIKRVIDKKIVVIVRGVYGEDCLNLAKALLEGGIELMEVAFDQASEEKRVKTVETIKLINDTLQGKVLMGAGTVTTMEMLKAAHEAGACGAGVGGNLVNKEWIANGEFDKIRNLAKEFIKNINS